MCTSRKIVIGNDLKYAHSFSKRLFKFEYFLAYDFGVCVESFWTCIMSPILPVHGSITSAAPFGQRNKPASSYNYIVSNLPNDTISRAYSVKLT